MKRCSVVSNTGINHNYLYNRRYPDVRLAIAVAL
jgi:hypothetical protein